MRFRISPALGASAVSAVFATILGFAYGASFSTGCESSAAAGAVLGCAEFIIFRYQTFIGIGGALIAAWMTAQPVWRQLKEMTKQNGHAQMVLFRARSVELSKEESLVYLVTTSIDIVGRALYDLHHRSSLGTLDPMALGDLTAAKNHMDESITRFTLEIGPLWGDDNVQNARTACRENAQRFSNTINSHLKKMAPYIPMTAINLDAAATELVPLKNAVFDAAVILHAANKIEQRRTGQAITAMERITSVY